jgi:hypothetical protein
VQLVDQIMREQGVDQLAAAVSQDVLEGSSTRRISWVHKPSIAILVLATGRLHHSVQCHEL